MVPICPHTLSDRPLVLPQEKSIELELQQNNKNKGEITIDGRSVCEFSENDKLVINKSKKETILIHPLVMIIMRHSEQSYTGVKISELKKIINWLLTYASFTSNSKFCNN